MNNYETVFTKEEIADIEKIIGYTFKDKRLLCKAFVHSSYANENGLASNERLEFFGDRILNFIVAKDLFLNVAGNEGDLKEELESRVSAPPLFALVEKLDLFRFVKRSKNVNFEKKKISDLFEALIAAVFTDSGSFEPCERLVSLIVPMRDENYIGKLKEYVEQNGLPYKFEELSDVSPFKCRITVGDKTFTGNGGQKKTAEKDACGKACKELGL